MAVFFVKSNENTYHKRESTHANVELSLKLKEGMSLCRIVLTYQSLYFRHIQARSINQVH